MPRGHTVPRSPRKPDAGPIPQTGDAVHLGRYVPSPRAEPGLRFLCDAPELERHADRPWFRAYAAERLDIPPEQIAAENVAAGTAGGAAPRSWEALVGMRLLARHAVVCGATGSGKTRLALRLLEGQINAGCSVVMLDPKIETIRHLLQIAHAAGLPPERVTVLSPHLSGAGAPGWNPLDAAASGVPPEQAAADVVSVLERSTSSWGPRMADLLTNALIVIAAHGLSLFELARLLQRDDYREALLRRPPPEEAPSAGFHSSGGGSVTCDSVAYEEARDYFVSEFAAWSKSERASAAAPVLNKFRELLRSPFLRSLLCARRTTLRLSDLWHRQGLVLVHLDDASLGDEGARLLGGLLAHQLLRTAMRADGPVPVVLALDEMGVSEEFVGGTASRILAIARSRGLRLLVACQHLAQLSDSLKTALLANTAVRAFFRLGHADARLVAASLAAGTGERISRVSADVTKRDAEGVPEAWARVTHAVVEGRGEPVALSGPARQALGRLLRGEDGAAQLEGFLRLAGVSGVGRLYVHAADTGRPVELCRYLKGLRPDEFALEGGAARGKESRGQGAERRGSGSGVPVGGGSEGSAPVRLTVFFPRPRLSVVSRETETDRERGWLRTLGELPERHAVLWLAGGPAGTVRVAEVADPRPAPGLDRFLSAAVAHGGQTGREVREAQAWRRERVEDIASGTEPAGTYDDVGRDGEQTRDGARASAGRAARPKSGRRPPPLPAAGTVAEDGSLA